MEMAAELKEVRAQQLDKFYTRREVAKQCLDSLEGRWPWSHWDLVVEPSAGSGSFFTQIPAQKKVGLDIAPDHPHIQTADFLEYQALSGQALLI